MPVLDAEGLMKLGFGDIIRIVWNNSYHKENEEHYGVIFKDQIGWEDGKIDTRSIIAESILAGSCKVYLSYSMFNEND